MEKKMNAQPYNFQWLHMGAIWKSLGSLLGLCGPLWSWMDYLQAPNASLWSHMALFGPILPLLVFIWLWRPISHPMDSIGALLASHVHFWALFGHFIQTKWVPKAKCAHLLSCDSFWHNRGPIRDNKLPCVAIMWPFGSLRSHIGP